MEPVTRSEVLAAAERIRGHVRRTPTMLLRAGEVVADVSVVAKLDLLQPTGSFKVRGATSLLRAHEIPSPGVVAASGGNFGLAVAWAARRGGHVAHVFVPSTSPAEKIAPIRTFGAVVHVVDGYYAEALAAADDHVAQTGALRAHAYDQREVVAGQGTATIELLEDHPDIDTIVVACGGGGLMAGTIAAARGRARVVAVETARTATLGAARAADGPVEVEVGGLAASSLGARRIGELAWAAQRELAAAVVVEDDDVREAQARLWRDVRLVAEPGGAAALAALTSGAYVPDPDERVAVLVCGANTDPASVVSSAALD